ncbi:ribonuclease [Bacillus anthracis]|nr:ribonuclease [Bacillus anthracis]
MKLSLYKRMYQPVLRLGNMQYFSDPIPNPEPNPTPEPNPEPLQITLEAVQSFINDDDSGKKWLQSLTDTRVTDAIKTYENKTLPKKIEDEIAKRFPAETEDQKQLRNLKQQFERLEAEKQTETLKNKALSIATEKGLPTKLVDYFIGSDEETTITGLGVLEEVFSLAVQQAVEEKFKQGGRDPKPPGEPGKALSKEAIEKMTPDEINENWEQVEKFLKGQ